MDTPFFVYLLYLYADGLKRQTLPLMGATRLASGK